MFRDRLVGAAHHVLIVTIVVMSMIALSAQTVVDPRYVEFNASAHHSVNSPSGWPMVTGYTLTIYPQGSATPFESVDLGKPTPGTGGVIRVDFLPLLNQLPTPGLLFEARVRAYGPGGFTDSTTSNSFSFSPACSTPSISPTSRSIAFGTATGSVAVTATAGCAWSAASNSSWITLTGTTSGMGSGTVPYSVAANPTSTQRTGSVTIAGQIFTVTQAGAPCSISIAPGTYSAAAAGGSSSTNVTAVDGCTWSATSNAAWLTLVGATSGNGNGTVSFNVSANPNASQRTGTLTIGGQTFTVTQAAAPCTYSILPTSQSVSSSATTGSAAVTSPSGCSWTATSNAAWITLTGGASGSGNGTTTFNIASNSNATPRTGTITIAGQTYTVSQAAAPCTYAISPSSQSVGAAATTGSAAVTSPTGCSWSSSSNASWITLTGGATGSGNGSATFNIAANPNGTTRTGTLTIAGQTYTVSQAAAACTYSISPSSQSVGAGATSGSSTVTAPTGCAWTATSNAGWLTLSGATSGNGNGTASFNIALNPNGTQRIGTLTIAGQTFTVTQAPTACTYSISPSSQSVGAGATTGSAAVTSPSGCAWSSLSNAGWITLTSGATGSGNGSATFNIAANAAGTPRSGTVTIAGQTYTVSQAAAGCTFSLSPGSQTVVAAGGTGSTSITAPAGCAWTASSSDSTWLAITSGASGSGSGTTGFSVAANPNGSQRIGTLTIGGQTFTVTQSAAPCTYSISPTSQSVGAAAGTGSTDVSAPVGCAWTAASNAAWLTLASGAAGSGDGSTTFNIAPNPNASQRTGTLTIAGRTFTVTQSAASCTYSISPSSQAVGAGASTGSSAVTTLTGCAWTAASNAPWITVTGGATGNSSGSTTFNIAANPDATPRAGTVTIAGQTYTVSQAASACTYSLTPGSQSVAAAGGTGSTSLSAPNGCPWTAASSNTSWLTITSAASGTGSSAVSFSAAANANTQARSATLTIGGQTFTVNQAAAACSFSIAPTTLTIGANGGTGSTAVSTTASCNWTAVSNVPWIDITGGASGTGGGPVSFSVEPTDVSTQRTGTLTIAGRTFTVTQAGNNCNYNLVPTSRTMTAIASSSVVFVSTGSACAWVSSTTASWITTNTADTGSGYLSFSVTTNTTGSTRTGTIRAGTATMTVTQPSTTVPTSPNNLRIVVVTGGS